MRYEQHSNIFHLLKHPEKYVGKDKIVTTRSSWERKFVLEVLDVSSNVLQWASEAVVIKYKFSLDNKVHRYFTDFYVKMKEGNEIKEYIIEIKPYDQTKYPKKPKKNNKYYNKKVCEYIKNQDKWKAAKSFCEKLRSKGRNIEFRILTEKELFNG